MRLLGRTIASALFEPGVLTVLADIISARGKGDLIEEIIDKEKAGLTIGEIEDLKNSSDREYSYKVVAVIRGEDYIIAPSRELKTMKDDRIVLVKGVREKIPK
jgi:K+/H+ antiporter YhaU regulatory subunit KhtT